MAYKRIKDKTNLIECWKLKFPGKYYFDVFLWKTQRDMEANSYDAGINTSYAVVNNAPSILCIYEDGKEEEIIRPKFGEIHFISKSWDVEVVSHECAHAIMQYLRMTKTSLADIVNQLNECEEDFCYLFGSIVYGIYKTLYDIDGQNWPNNGE